MHLDLFRRLRARAGPSTTHSSSKQRVLKTYELLEHILELLDPHSLRRARLVDTYWCSIVLQSPSLATRVAEFNGPRDLHTVLVGVPSGGIHALVYSFKHGPPSPPSWQTHSLWESSFEKAITVDNERWTLHGSMDDFLDGETRAALFGHRLINSETYMLVYSKSSRESFDRLRAWLASMDSATEPLSMLVAKQAVPNKATSSNARPKKCIPAALISTNNDATASMRAVSPAEGVAFARELGCPFIETSAKSGDGVQEAFAEVCRTYKRVRLEELRKQSKRSSLTKVFAPSDTGAKERRERWWRWYQAKQRRCG